MPAPTTRPGASPPIASRRTILRFFLPAALVLACGCVRLGGNAEPAPAGDPDDIVATVDGEPILRADLDALLAEMIAAAPPELSADRIERIMPRLRKNALDVLIDQALLFREVAKHPVAIGGDEIDREIRILDENFASLGGSLERRMAETSMTREHLRREIREQLEHDRTIDRLLDLQPPTREQIETFHKRHSDRYVWPRAARVHQIVIAFPADRPLSAADRAQLHQRADTAYQHLLADEPFAQVAARYSDRPAADAIDLGWINDSASLPRAVLDAAFDLSPGQFSEVLTSPVGYHLIQVVERRDRRVPSLEEVEEIVAHDLSAVQRLTAEPRLQAILRDRAEIVIEPPATE
jgi:peptidyl-prolyl cis-trans isomerase SurA